MMAGAEADPIARAVFYAVIGCWFIFFLTFGLRARRPRIQETKRDRTAMAGLFVQAVGYFGVWFYPLQRKQFSAIVPMPRTAEIVLAVLTVALAAASVWLVDAASRQLGKQWGLAARLVEGHDLISDGPYRLVRNPIYAGMFGLLLATGLAMSRWTTLLAASAVFVAGTLIRIRSEEKLLRQAFGATFEEYARKVPALFPGIY
ncbi:MAG: isoprenylcysteine carboxylmethyltransferase family protein [Acidobacteriia bacterium]|nr:isoprenylcysteine carboxylmethyltransferase family protein [Terriglobia bacterium]